MLLSKSSGTVCESWPLLQVTTTSLTFVYRDSHTYHGPWQFNNIRQQWEGNPVNSAEVMDITSSLKHKASSEGGDQKHSLPMLKDNMVHILAWSQKTSPKLDQALGWLHHVLSGHSELSLIHVHAKKWVLVK